MLNIGTILDSALSRQHDDSDEFRAICLNWLNEAIQQLYVERDWKFLRKIGTLTVVDSSAALPDDFGRFVHVSGASYYLKRNHQYTDEDIETYDSDNVQQPLGFALGSENITFYPEAQDEDVTLVYIQTLPIYADLEDTIIPEKFFPLLTRTLTTALYEYEADQRAMVSLQLEPMFLNKLQIEENRNAPIPKTGRYL